MVEAREGAGSETSPDGSGPLGHELVGTGPVPVIVLNDWMGDTSTWDGARAYLDRERFTWAFTDLRGYGRSRHRTGSYTLREAASDVLQLADAHGWATFVVVGHSMSSLIALHLAQQHGDRVTRAVALTPPPPRGFGVDDQRLEQTRALALADDARRAAALKQRFGARLSPGWAAYKAARWSATSEPSAVAAYVAMFSRDGLPDPVRRIHVPVLAVTGELDFEPMRAVAVKELLAPLCEHLTVVPLVESGHYPMQEMPPLLVAHVERFLSDAP